MKHSVRVGLGDFFYKKKEKFVEGQMVSAIRKLGADYVFDDAFSADLTTMEEGTEFLGRLLSARGPLPQFTNCCPAWVKYVETFYPERIGNLSSAKRPISMQGAVIKTYFAREKGIDPEKIVNVAVAPCSAKKFEIMRKELGSAGCFMGMPQIRDNDYVLTTRELAEWIASEHIDFEQLEPSAFDPVLGEGSGAGVIFGNTGGVMEAALRMTYSTVTGKEPGDLLMEYESVRGLEQIKETSVRVGEHTVRTAVVYGTRRPDNGVVPVPDHVRAARRRNFCTQITTAGRVVYKKVQ